MKIINIILILSLLTTKVALRDRRGLFDNLNSGFQIPGISNKIADLVSQAFNKNNEAGNMNRQDTVMVGSTPNDPTTDNSLVSPLGLLKLLGFDSSKIGAFALNGIVFIAQMLSQMLIKKKPSNRKQDFDDDIDDQQPSKAHDYDPFVMMLENDQVSSMLSEIRDKNLPSKLMSSIKEKGTDADCIMMLVCKVTPFIFGLQNAVIDRIDGTNNKSKVTTTVDSLSVFFQHLPSFEEFKKTSKKCEKTYNDCRLF